MNIIKKIKLFFLYHQRNYKKVLENTVFDETKKVEEIDTSSLKYQSYASFFTKNYHHSQMCLELLKEKNNLTSFENNLLAYIYARHNKIDKAITEWCSAQEKNKNNKISQNALEYLRKKEDSIDLREDEFFDTVIPNEPFFIPFKRLNKIIIFLIIFSGLVYGMYYLLLNFKDKLIFKKLRTRNEINNIYLPDYNPNLLEKPKIENTKYSYNEKEIKNKFEKAKKFILKNQPVEAQLEINEIKLSNASNAVKFKVDILEDYIEEPDYALFKNIINFNDILSERDSIAGPPLLYQNIYILWEGRVVNHLVTKEKITFDLILGNEEKGIVEAVIPVVFQKAVIVKNNDKLKVFGRIKIIEEKIYIEGRFVIKN